MAVPSLREQLLALAGIWRLLRFDDRGFAYFEPSAEAAARSFFAAVLLAPLYAITLTLAFRGGTIGVDATPVHVGPLRFALVEGIAYVISWTAYPLIVEWLTRRLNCREQFAGYLTVYNWSMVPQNSAVLLFSLLLMSHVIPAALLQVLWIALFMYMLVFLSFIARKTLAVSPLTAAGLVLLDISLSAFVDAITSNMY